MDRVMSKLGRDESPQLARFSENREHAPVDAGDPARHRIAANRLWNAVSKGGPQPRSRRPSSG